MSRLKVSLTIDEEVALKEQFQKSEDIRIRERCHAILLRIKGYKIDEVADILFQSISTIKLWTRLYREGGLTNLNPKPQPGNHRKLTNEQKNVIRNDLNDSTPNDLGYNGCFWTVDILKKHVKKRFSVEFQSDRSYHALFRYGGFTFHRPTKKDRRQDEAKVKEFEDELKKNSKKLMKTQLYWQKMK